MSANLTKMSKAISNFTVNSCKNQIRPKTSFSGRYLLANCSDIDRSVINNYCKNKSYAGVVGDRQYSQAATTLTKEQLTDLVYRLNEDERDLLMNTLQKFESNKEKAKFEGQLAATVWRSKFGRPAKMEPLVGNADPTGSYCAIPDDWYEKKFAATTPPPSTNDLLKLCFVNALPFIGFGFLDNFTMIIAGDYIESTFGFYMCISTMAAAALGNTISDVIGIGSAFYVERIADAIGVRPPKLSPFQMEMKCTRRSANFGRVLGITIGCILGMCPLFFMDHDDKRKREKEEKEKAALVENPSQVENTVVL